MLELESPDTIVIYLILDLDLDGLNKQTKGMRIHISRDVACIIKFTEEWL